MLRVVFPLAFKDPSFRCHVPFDAVERPTDGQEVPAQRWVDVTDGRACQCGPGGARRTGRAGVALLNDTKYGHSFEKGELRLTLLRSSYGPDIYPDQGLHRIRYSLFPHEGDWKAGVWAEADDFNTPALATEPPSAALGAARATRPAEDSLISLEPANVTLSGLKESEEGDELVARIVEVEGRETEAALTLPLAVKSARRLDIIERPLGRGLPSPEIDGRTVRVRLRAHEIATLGIQLQERPTA